MAGAYVDDLNVAFRASLLRLVLIGSAIVAVTLLATWLVNRDITASLGALNTAMDRLAKGDLATVIPGAQRRDEIGGMAATVVVFKDNMVEAERLRTAQEETKAHAAAEHKAARHRMADSFESKVGHLVAMLSSASTQLEATAQSMAGTANESKQRAVATASAAEEASTGLQTVAAAAEELSASIGEISRQVAQSSRISGKAVNDARRTDVIVHALAEGAEKVGAVVGLITSIASQTNLSGPERHDRGGAGRGCRQRLCRGGLEVKTGQPDRQGDGADRCRRSLRSSRHQGGRRIHSEHLRHHRGSQHDRNHHCFGC